ncbi:SMI1/KNR4 family protein [Stieleria mannarensis]|uniref:SMI1/KNR4 family protein n=1 Tax=Stieleria mannarensis TaxID=2755585 RepID=UPI0016042A84|nr:SMI1/KNR4 family protein [Rhodopirellula sp. JC639]
MPPLSQPSAASGSWSDQIQARFRCVLSDDLVRWFDNEIWRFADGSGGNRFASAIAPAELIDDAPSAIWPALMPCDFLPILTNTMGDWLCIRMAADNTAAQVVHWYHGGGDWIPWGDSLAEAIYFDHVRHRLPGSGRDHAISAGSAVDDDDGACEQLNRWALGRLEHRSVRELEPLRGAELADEMVRRGICQPAVLCQLVIDALENPFLSDDAVRALKVDDAEQVQRALFDNRLMDRQWIDQLFTSDVSHQQVLDQQNWDAVAQHCRRAIQIAPDLGWGWDLLGYSQERSGNLAAAIEHYRRGLECSIFTDQTVRVRTHGFSGEGQKFAAARLMKLGYQPTDPIEKNYFQRLGIACASERRDQIREHFASLARQAAPAKAHELWVRAGWDMGAEPMLAFAELLEQIAISADAAGRAAQGELARTHRNCFRDRYGI